MAAQGSVARNILLGFVTGAIAVVIAHQLVVFVLAMIGMLPTTTRAWNMAPYGPFGVPTLVNSMFWGGLWGALFGLIWDKLPGSAMWVRGLIYGILIALISNFTLLPLIRQALGVTNPAQIALFAGFDPRRMLATLLILGGFGIVLGVLYGLVAKR